MFEQLLEGLAWAARWHPQADPDKHGVELIRDVAYRPTGHPAHRLDIYRPKERPGPRPVVLYVHGGAFRILSKDSHWVMGLIFARFGYTVFNINYRLGPRHPYPAALADTCDALNWVYRHAEAFGGDPDRIAAVGESAGGNLVTALALATAYRRPEPWAQRVWHTGVGLKAVIPACALLQVTDIERFFRRRSLPVWVGDRIREAGRAYVPLSHERGRRRLDLADPVVLLEAAKPPERPLPPFFAFVGTRDPLLDDTRRLEAALQALAAPVEARYYPGGIHAFHAMVWRQQAKDCWRDQLRFLGRHLGLNPSRGTRRGRPAWPD